MNYGAIGFVIGHEITHGFDDQGRQFDKNGNLVDWWAKATEEKFIKRAQCIINQYGNYTAEEVGLKVLHPRKVFVKIVSTFFLQVRLFFVVEWYQYSRRKHR